MTDQLERLIGNVLRDQPLRRAPPSLEARVLARIQQHEMLVAQRTGFARWPMTARIALILALLAVAKLTVDLFVWIFSAPQPVSHTVETSVTWAKSTASLFTTLVSLGEALFRVIPPSWITLGLAISASLYIVLFVLGATAYRTLYLNK